MQQFNNKKNILQLVDFCLYTMVLSSLFLPHRINGFLVMLLIIFSGLRMIAGNMTFKGVGGLFFLPVIFLVICLGLLYSSDTAKGWELVGRNLALILLPFAVQSIVQMQQKNMRLLLHFFVASAFITSLVCLGIATAKSIELGTVRVSADDDHFLYNVFMHHRLSEPLNLHAVYFSWFIAFANLFVLQRFIKTNTLKSRLGLGSLFLFFCIMIYLLKSAMIGFGFVSCALLVISYAYGKSLWANNRTTLITLSTFSLLIIFGVITVVSKVETFSLTYDINNPQLSTLAIRLSIWECALSVIQENWLLGTGTGDGQAELMESYINHSFTIGQQENFNVHNMYLEYWMSNGIFAVGLFCTGLIVLFKKALKAKNILFLSFVILFVLFSFTESTMRTQKGLIFFILMAAIFYWRPQAWMQQTKKPQA